MKEFTPTFGTGHVTIDEDGQPFLCTRVTKENYFEVSNAILNKYELIFSKEAVDKMRNLFATKGEAWIA